MRVKGMRVVVCLFPCVVVPCACVSAFLLCVSLGVYLYILLFGVKVAYCSPSYDNTRMLHLFLSHPHPGLSSVYLCLLIGDTFTHLHTYDAHQLAGAQITSTVAATLPVPSSSVVGELRRRLLQLFQLRSGCGGGSGFPRASQQKPASVHQQM